MARVKKTTSTRMGMVVEEYQHGRYGAPGNKREQKRALTPEEMQRQNQWQKEKRTWVRLMHYFEKNDYFMTLTYHKEERPADMKEAKEHFRRFRERVRKEYKKRGYELRWIRNIEVGSKGAWHIHVIVNRIPDADIILRAAWPYGKMVSQLMYEQGSFRDLAAYITKTPRTDRRLKESDFDCGRNMPLPEPDKKVYKHWRKEILIPRGYYLDKDSLREGRNPVTDYPYRVYALIRIGPGEKKGGGNRGE